MTFSVSVSLSFPFIRSNRIVSIFPIVVANRPGAPPTRKCGKLACQPTGSAWPIDGNSPDNSTRPFASILWYTAMKVQNGNGNTATALTERQYEHGFTETDTDERKRNAGNQALRGRGITTPFSKIQ